MLLRSRQDLTDEQFLLLDGWIRNYPLLGEAYRLKEEFFSIYEAEDVSTAKIRYAAWANSIPTHLLPHFQPIITSWRNWETEILEYFNHRITNAFSESLNAILRALERAGRGYSFEALRAKILFLPKAHKRVSPRFARQPVDERLNVAEPIFGYGLPNEIFGKGTNRIMKYQTKLDEEAAHEIEPGKNLGVDVSTLLRLIEQGEI